MLRMADNDAGLEAAAAAIRGGGLVGYPTDTLYGLGADVHDPRAVAAVLAAKGRAAAMGIPVLIADPGDLERVTASVPPEAWLLAERFWPGALTLVLSKSPDIPPAATGGLDTVALRVPAHDTPRALARLLGCPVTGTSANRSGRPGLTDADEVRREFEGECCMVLDGRCAGGVASTLVDLTGSTPRVLREGAISRAAISEVCASIAYQAG